MRPPASTAASSYRLAFLRGAIRPFRLHYVPRLRSTNDHAAALRRRGELFAPAVVLTSRQIAGRGRGGNSWWSARGSITITFAVGIEEHLEPQQMALVGGLAVRDALAEISGSERIKLKWPNDVMYGRLKVAGVLCERIHRIDLIGIGVNLNSDVGEAPPELRNRIVALRRIAGRPLDMTESVIAIARHLRRLLIERKRRPFAAIEAEYRRHL